VVEVAFDSGTVICLVYVIAPTTTNALWLLLAPSQFVRLDSAVDFQWQLLILGLSRLSWDIIRDCNLDIQLLDSSAGVFGITTLGGHFTVLRVQLLLLLHVHLPMSAFPIGECISQHFVPALQVQQLAVGVVAILVLSSPPLKIVSPRKTHLRQL